MIPNQFIPLLINICQHISHIVLYLFPNKMLRAKVICDSDR